MTDRARHLLEEDDELQQLLQLAKQHPDGFDAVIDADANARVSRALLSRFARVFPQLPLGDRGRVLLDLLASVGVPANRAAMRLFGRLDAQKQRALLDGCSPIGGSSIAAPGKPSLPYGSGVNHRVVASGNTLATTAARASWHLRECE
ncbi:MAG: hypothetical protein GTO15_00030 [Pseudomonas stutzeri]|nr:hypothetical protein [Stutzerimonas stutzeri]